MRRFQGRVSNAVLSQDCVFAEFQIDNDGAADETAMAPSSDCFLQKLIGSGKTNRLVLQPSHHIKMYISYVALKHQSDAEHRILVIFKTLCLWISKCARNASSCDSSHLAVPERARMAQRAATSSSNLPSETSRLTQGGVPGNFANTQTII